MDRRHFLLAAAAANQSWAQANDRVRVAIVGVGSRGTAHIKEMLPVPNLEIAALCDVDGARAEAASQTIFAKTGKRPILETDMRRIFDDKSIDAVSIATTNHWHALTAIWAMQAGKDVYVEKPVSHNIFEGTKVVEAARKYKRMAAGGTQRRWWGKYRKAIEVIHSGAIGEIYQGNFTFPGNRDSLGFKPFKEPPANLNWDLWVGPAPMQKYHENLVPYNWHWFWDFGNGELGNNGIHMIDVLRWGMKQKMAVSVRSTGGRFGYKDQGETPNSQNVTWTFADGSSIVGQLRGLYTDEPMSWDFFGSKGHMHMFSDGRFRITMGRSKKPEPEMEYYSDIDHFAKFTEAVRTRNSKLIEAEIEETAISTALCHQGNISYRLKRELKFDPATMLFVNDKEANALVTRKYRAPYVVPERV
ncbi:Gfo/Idh/MocA family protein [Bryobacter aggregatus]|uniref:Gfo/Idh/MocA family protein n=1 Tax=Bryobacter aggregatus TaxID=360054 RepID=UPI0004E230F7|nr:Gfo/Idh/MocA family oxidoreductase [Bryobacter aggregatus]